MPFFRTPAAAAVACLLAATSAFAQVPPRPRPDARPPAPRLAEVGPETVVSGRVARWLVNPNGDVDGLLFDDGTQVAVPPHLSAKLIETVKVKDAVEVTGRHAESAKLVRASMIRNTASGRSVDLEPRDPEAGPPQPRPVGALTAMNASGRIDALLRTGRGDINGALLQDGTVVRFPPHVAQAMPDTLKTGAVLYARGYGTRSAQGSALEATALGATAETARDVFTGPGPGAGPDRDPPRPPPPDAPPPVPPRTPKAP